MNTSPSSPTAHSAHPRVSEQRQWISIAEAADYLGVSTKTVRRMVAAGHIPMYRFGPRIVRFDRVELDAVARRVPTARGDVR